MQVKESRSVREVRSYALEIRATGNSGEVEGYGSVFGVKDSYDDIIIPGAFAETLKAHKASGTMPALLWQHNQSEPIGVWREMSEDAKGLRMKGQLALDTVRGKEAFALMKLGALNGLSIGFVTNKSTRDHVTDIRTITEIDLWEVSLVTFPANTNARVTDVRAIDLGAIQTIRQAEQALRDAGLSGSEAKGLIAQVKRIALEERDAPGAAAALKAAKRLLDSLTTT